MNDELKKNIEKVLLAPYQDENEDGLLTETQALINQINGALDESSNQYIDNLPHPHNWKLAGGQMSVDLVDFCGSDQMFLAAARVSTSTHEAQTTKERDLKLAKFLLKHNHTSPFEHAFITYRIEAPIFSARQIMRHRTFSYNEISRRYTEKNLEFYLPKKLYAQDKNRLQCSTDQELDQKMINSIELATRAAFNLYQRLLAQGVSREQARFVLPMNTMTTFYMSGNFYNWIKFLKLRCDEHTQEETRLIAGAIKQSLGQLYPDTMNILDELNKL